MASQRQMMIKMERMFKRIVDQNDAMMEMMEARLPSKKKTGRPKKEQIVIDVEEVVLPANKAALEASKAFPSAIKEKLQQTG